MEQPDLIISHVRTIATREAGQVVEQRVQEALQSPQSAAVLNGIKSDIKQSLEEENKRLQTDVRDLNRSVNFLFGTTLLSGMGIVALGFGLLSK